MHILCVKLKDITRILLLILTLVMLSVNINGNVAASVFFGSNLRKVPIYYVNTSDSVVALSFDAAWGADKTEKIMEICKSFNVNATFFLVGFWVEKYPEIAKKIKENGFEIGTHSNTHPDMTKLSALQQKLELQSSVDLIKSVTNAEVELFRAPFGAYNDTLLETANALNLKTIQWDIDTLDWKGLGAMEITNRILNGVRNGSIILCHNNSDHILDALPIFLDRLIKRGYAIKSVGEVVIKEGYFIDNNGMQSAKI